MWTIWLLQHFVRTPKMKRTNFRSAIGGGYMGSYRVPESRPKGGTALINMFEPALASLSLRRTALIVDATR